MRRCISCFWCGQIHYLGKWNGVGPRKSRLFRFLGPEWHSSRDWLPVRGKRLQLRLSQVFSVVLFIYHKFGSHRSSVSDPDSIRSVDPYPVSDPVPGFIDPVFAKTISKRSFSVIENELVRLVFAKTGSLNSGTWGQKWPTKIEKIKKIHVLKRWMFSFEGWRLFL